MHAGWAIGACATLWASASPAQSAAPEPPAAPSGEAAAPDDPAEAAHQSVTPVASRTQLKVKPSYTFPKAGGYKAEVLTEADLPFDGLLIPGLVVSGMRSVSRLELPLLAQEKSDKPAGGLGDLQFVDLTLHTSGILTVGAGFATIFPSASTAALGDGKWQLGPAGGLSLDPSRRFHLAVLLQNLWSVAGSNQSAKLNYLTVQPFLEVHLAEGVFLSSDATMSFDWLGGPADVPLNLFLGRAFGTRFVGALGAEYTLTGSHQGDLELLGKLTFRL